MTFRDRVVDFRRVKAGELVANPRNWRRHPKAQRDALATVLDQIGFAGAIVTYEDNGALVIIDGHLRQDMDADVELPVLITDLTPDEANALLATFDPLGAMAETDAALLGDLLTDVNAAFAGMEDTLAAVGETMGIENLSHIEFPEYDETIADDVEMCECPNCGHKFPK